MAMAYAAVWFCFLSIFFNLISLGIAAIRVRPGLMPLPPPRAAPGVSVVRPLCGLDNFCEETLQSSFELDYPSYEIIFCVARATDPAGDEKVSANPKLNNCVRGWTRPATIGSFSPMANVLMPKDYIQRLLMSWRHRSGLVCSMPLGSRPGNRWAELECAFLNTFEARWQYCAEAFGMGFAQGKSMLWRREGGRDPRARR